MEGRRDGLHRTPTLWKLKVSAVLHVYGILGHVLGSRSRADGNISRLGGGGDGDGGKAGGPKHVAKLQGLCEKEESIALECAAEGRERESADIPSHMQR